MIIAFYTNDWSKGKILCDHLRVHGFEATLVLGSSDSLEVLFENYTYAALIVDADNEACDITGLVSRTKERFPSLPVMLLANEALPESVARDYINLGVSNILVSKEMCALNVVGLREIIGLESGQLQTAAA